MLPEQNKYQKIVNHLFSINRALKQMLHTSNDEVINLTLLQIHALIYVKKQPKMMLSDLATKLHITKASLNTLINKLVENKWLIKIEDKQDRRITFLELSEKSVRRFKLIMDKNIESIKLALDKLTGEEVEKLGQIIEKLDEIIINQIEIEGGDK